MAMSGDGVTAGDSARAGGTGPGPLPVFDRVLIAIDDAGQAEHMVELARRAGASHARVLHVSVHESIRGRRYALENESAASRAAEATVLEFAVAGIAASGQICHTLVGRAAEAIVAEAAGWGADLIMLGAPQRGEFMTRLSGSVTLRILQHAPCPVLVGASAGAARLDPAGAGGYAHRS
jgi:nucleotide-binding universal stress UspA family protein